MMGFTAQLDKEINFEATTYKLFNIMSLHYKQKKKLQRHQSALRQNQGEDGYVKKRKTNVSIKILSLIY